MTKQNTTSSLEDFSKRKRPAVSLKAKFLFIYVGLLTAVLVLISLVLPSILNRFLVQEKLRSLDEVKEVVAGVLKDSDFRRNPEARKILAAAADASDICVWIATPLGDNMVEISVYGHLGGDMESTNFAAFTDVEKQYIKSVLNGEEMSATQRAFPTAFDLDTISVGYCQTFFKSTSFPMGNTEGTFGLMNGSGAVFLHADMSGVYIASKTLQLITFATLLLLALAATAMTSMMGNNILIPVYKLKDAAEAISKGDFSQKVEFKSNDEIGMLTNAFNEMSSQLQEVDRLQTDFIANISHDFRSPLTSIRGYVEAMLDGTIPPELHEKYLQIVLDESYRLTKMTNNVLDLTKMENGQYELNRVDFDINETIVKLALSLEQRIEEKNINMEFHFLQDTLKVNADIDLMERVIYNLLDNALKFTESGDTIAVETSIVGKKAYIVVSDTGSGIDEASLPHIFDRFNKGDKSRGKNKMGTGLGLAIVRQIMLNHQEDIKVYSKQGEGTKFSFTLPLAK